MKERFSLEDLPRILIMGASRYVTGSRHRAFALSTDRWAIQNKRKTSCVCTTLDIGNVICEIRKAAIRNRSVIEFNKRNGRYWQEAVPRRCLLATHGCRSTGICHASALGCRHTWWLRLQGARGKHKLPPSFLSSSLARCGLRIRLARARCNEILGLAGQVLRTKIHPIRAIPGISPGASRRSSQRANTRE